MSMGNKKEKVLVTGGGGFLGKAIIKFLIQDEFEVFSFSRSYYPELESLGVTCIQGDLTNYTDVKRALEGIDGVFHVAALAGVWGKYEDYFQTNVIGTKNIVNACLELGIKKLVYTSSPSVILDSSESLSGANESLDYPQKYSNFYGETKAVAERYVLSSNGEKISTCALRPHLIWGPGDPHIFPRIFGKAQKKQLRIIGDGLNKVDIIFVENAAKAHLLAYKKLAHLSEVAGQAYFLGQEEEVFLWDFINEVLKRGGYKAIKKKIPFKLAYFIGFIFEVFYRALRITKEPPLTRFVCNQLGKDHYFSHQKARAHFGYCAEISTQEGLNRFFH